MAKSTLSEYQKQYREANKEEAKLYKANWYLENKERTKDARKANYYKNIDSKRNNDLFSKYNITLEQYNQMFSNQKGCCKICSRHQTELKTRLHVDHDHDTGEIRGLLCGNCNTALGLMYDNIETITNAIKYLKENE